MDTIEILAKAFWNAEAIPSRANRVADTAGGYYASYSAVLWDDDDMLERDRALFRRKARAALSALSVPEAISEGMVTAVYEEYALIHSKLPSTNTVRRLIRAALAAAAQEVRE